MNTFKTFVLMLIMTGLLMAIGWAMGGNALYYALFFAIAFNMVTYWFSDKIVLMTYRAQPVQREQAPELFDMVEEITQRVGMPMPKVYVIPGDHANAFATGRSPSHAAVAFTAGILDILDKRELRAVLAHELAHVKHRDILTATVVACMAAAIMMLSRWAFFFGGGRRDGRGGNGLVLLLTLIVAPIAAMLIQLSISRSREYAADAGAARFTNDPLGLASALRKLETSAARHPLEASPSSAHLFIVKPFRGKDVMALFSTHPPIAERVKRLEEMAKRMQAA